MHCGILCLANGQRRARRIPYQMLVGIQVVYTLVAEVAECVIVRGERLSMIFGRGIILVKRFA